MREDLKYLYNGVHSFDTAHTHTQLYIHNSIEIQIQIQIHK